MNNPDSAMAAGEVVLACRNLCKHYQQGPQRLQVLDHINLSVQAGERIAVVGTSGSGKSTLLNMLGGLDLPSSGEIRIAGNNLAALSERGRDQIRNRYLGFVYQFHHLMGEFSAEENVAMPLLIAGSQRHSALEQARQMLSRVGLAARLAHKPAELSGGERQRVAIARALINQPHCVLLDEPTGNLDRHSAEQVHALMLELNQQLGTSFVVVTHDPQLAARMDRVLELSDGQLAGVA